jgi:glycosyltransferase involved in cell wall biosynthesis
LSQTIYPFLSIITICYNSELTIAKTIASVKKQKTQKIEYLLIDGASNDKTLEIINSYNDGSFIVKSEPDQGIADAFNKGIEIASGEYILLLNSDDYLLDNALRPTIDFLYNNPHVDIYCGNMLVQRKGKIVTIESKPEHLRQGMSVAHPATIVKREVFQKVGLFSEKYKIAMDYEFLLRCQLQGIKFYSSNQSIIFMEEKGVSAQKFFLGKKEVYQIRSQYQIKQPPLFIFMLTNTIRHYLGLSLSIIMPTVIYQQLRSLRYKAS